MCHKRLPLELVHAQLGHCQCCTLLAANKHQLWKNVTIRMSPETGCLSCGIATFKSTVRNKEHHSGASHPGEYVFLDIQHPITSTGLRPQPHMRSTQSLWTHTPATHGSMGSKISLPKKSLQYLNSTRPIISPQRRLATSIWQRYGRMRLANSHQQGLQTNADNTIFTWH